MKTPRIGVKSRAKLVTDGVVLKRECVICHDVLPLERFYCDGRGYLRLLCKTCERQQMKDWRNSRKSVGGCTGCSRPAQPGRTQCLACTKRMLSNQIARRARNKVRAVALLGGICVDCEGRFEHHEVYDFHHLDPKAKDHDLTDGDSWMAYRWEKLERELKKCVLLCANCHRIRHAREREASRQTAAQVLDGARSQ